MIFPLKTSASARMPFFRDVKRPKDWWTGSDPRLRSTILEYHVTRKLYFRSGSPACQYFLGSQNPDKFNINNALAWQIHASSLEVRLGLNWKAKKENTYGVDKFSIKTIAKMLNSWCDFVEHYTLLPPIFQEKIYKSVKPVQTKSVEEHK